jgi:molybdopterin converting factor small subunit
VKTADYPAGTTVGDVADGLTLPRAEVGIVLINSRHAELGRQLADGDTLALFPLLGGG